MNQTTNPKQKLSFAVTFDVEGVQFAESLIDGLIVNLNHALQITVSEGLLSERNDDQSIITLSEIAHLNPTINIIQDNGTIEQIHTNLESLVVNVIDDPENSEEEDIFQLNGDDHVSLDSERTNSYSPEASDIFSGHAHVSRLLQLGNFVDVTLAEFITTTEELKFCPVFHCDEKSWTREQPVVDFFEAGFEVYYTKDSKDVVLYRFNSEQLAKYAVSVWAEARKRLNEE